VNAIAPYFKSVVAFIVPGIIALIAAVSDGSDNGQTITGPEWISILAACILTAAGVWGVPNRDPNATHQRESVQPPPPPGRHEAGASGLDTLGYFLAALGVILVLVDLITVTAGLIWPGIILLIAGVIILVIGRTHTTHH
jgi:uncharacterized membrane protein HdeD (DUF308 family)